MEKKVKTIEDVFLDKLISVVDENIEKTEDYKNGFLKHIILWSFRESKGKKNPGKSRNIRKTRNFSGFSVLTLALMVIERSFSIREEC